MVARAMPHETPVRLKSEIPPIPSSWDDLLEGIETADQWRERQATLKVRFLEMIRDEAKPARVPLELRIEEERVVDDSYRLRWISYQVEADERASAAVGIPLHSAEPTPGVVALHGTRPQGAREAAGLEGSAERAHIDHLCRRGFTVIAPEHFVSGRRLPERAFDTAGFYERHPDWSAVGKFTHEHAIATDVLASLPGVDASRLGVIGHSLGGQGAYFLAAYDERLKAAVCNCSAGTFRHNPGAEHWARESWYVYFRHLRESLVRGEAPPMDMHEIIALIAPRAYLDVFAWNDPQGHTPTQKQRVLLMLKHTELYDLLGESQNFGFFLHGRGHTIPAESRALIYEFLEVHLGRGRSA